MMTVREAYNTKYNPKLGMALFALGGDPDGIINYWQNRLDSPTEEDTIFQTMTFYKPLTVERAAEQAFFQITREIKRIFFGAMPREAAVAICNALYNCPDGQFIIAPGNDELKYNAYTFCFAWNDHNPGELKIITPHNDIG